MSNALRPFEKSFETQASVTTDAELTGSSYAQPEPRPLECFTLRRNWSGSNLFEYSSGFALHACDAEPEEPKHFANRTRHSRLNTSRGQAGARNWSGPKFFQFRIPASKSVIAELKDRKSTSPGTSSHRAYLGQVNSRQSSNQISTGHGHWTRGFRSKPFSGRLWPEELGPGEFGPCRSGQVGRSCRRVRVK